MYEKFELSGIDGKLEKTVLEFAKVGCSEIKLQRINHRGDIGKGWLISVDKSGTDAEGFDRIAQNFSGFLKKAA